MRLIQDVLGSKSKIQLLSQVIDSPHSFSITQLSRLSNQPKSTVAILVSEWGRAGLVKSNYVGQTRVVTVNQSFPLLDSIRTIFSSYRQLTEKTLFIIRNSPLLKSRNVVCVVIFGSLARKEAAGESDTDILIILKKETKENDTINHLWDELHGKIPFSPAVVFLTEKEVIKRLNEKDHFMQNVFTEGIALKGEDWFGSTQRTFRNRTKPLSVGTKSYERR